MTKPKKPKPIPFNFAFDYLPLSVTVKPMFGMFAVYLGGRIVLVLREREKSPEKNGVWLAMGEKDPASLKNDLPGLVPISLKAAENQKGQWQYLPADLEDFEALVIKACGFIRNNDQRIGHIPGAHKPKVS